MNNTKNLRLAMLLMVTFIGFYGKSPAQELTLSRLLGTPYISNLTVSRTSADMFFTVNEQGKRNVYRAKAPDYELERLTGFDEDDGQEITSLSVSKDGKWLVFVRGGDHGANSSARAVNPASYTEPPGIILYSISLTTGKVRILGEGDFPVIHPELPVVTFLRKYQAWTVPLDGSLKSEPLFTTRGSVRSLQWSPDGLKLAFSVRRGDHAFIGVYQQGNNRLQWIAPSFHRDGMPRWSADSRSIAFVRRPGTGRSQDPILEKKHQPWSVMVGDLTGGSAKTVWEAPRTLSGSYPRWPGGANLHWQGNKGLVFLSYHDGWPHLYRVDLHHQSVRQLTSGAFSVDQVTVSNDGKKILFGANTGPDKEDIDRRHIGLIDVEQGTVNMITSGTGLESSPLFMPDGRSVAMLRGTATEPPLPVILKKGDRLIPIGRELFGDVDYSKLITPEQVTFRSEDGVSIHGQLFKPKNAQGKTPAVVYIHGGPRRQMYLGWHFIDYYFHDYAVNQYLASQGIAVLSVNYRMGTGYGFDFQNPSNAGNQGASEYRDILAAGKWLARQPGIEASEIGVFGGSYGGYLTAMALGRDSDVFKAGVDIHGVHNRMLKQNREFYPPDFDTAAQLAWESSPSKWVNGWTSPALIIHSDDDQNVPFLQSTDLVNRLRGEEVDVEYLVIPDDTHHWMRFENLLKVKQATADFLRKQLLSQ